MEEAPVTAATGALGPVVAKLSALLRRRGEYQLRQGTRKDVKLIRSKLKSVHSILWVIWEREDRDTASKELRMEAWRLADDMNDAIDDFILSMKRSNDGRRFIQAKIQPSPFQDLRARAEFVSQRCRNKWKKTAEAVQTTISSLFSRTKTTVDSCPAKLTRLVDPYVHKDVSEVVGILKERRDGLIKGLKLAEEESTPQLKMASILGAAGMGKTTLARLVYEEIEDKFQARAFVSITSSHNMTEVLSSILQQVAPPSIPLAATKPATENHLVDSISNFLKDKRYLVIIDDIWHCGEWETIKKSLPDNNLGSRIVTTSRVKSIAEMWRDNFDALVSEIRHLSYPDVCKMIGMKTDMVGKDFDKHTELTYLCRGTPLAVVCMISAVAKERERQEQQGLCVPQKKKKEKKKGAVCSRDTYYARIEEQIERKGIQNTPGFEPLVESLELEYKDLPHHMLKTCLLYCSIYPQLHMFCRDDMVRRWIAEGFVCTEEVGKDYFDELVSRGWIISASRGGIATDYCFMYPMMRSYLRCKLREDNFITFSSDIPSSPIGRLCIDYWPGANRDPLSGIDWHHIRSLVVFEGSEKVPYNHLRHLRVLDVKGPLPLKGPPPLPRIALENQHLKDMCGLVHLRHLLCLGSDISEIPAEIISLKFLETLELGATKITRLPAHIGDLKQLKTLGLTCNELLTELPREIGNLQHLETLRIHRSHDLREQAWEIIGTLKKLKTLDVRHIQELSAIPRNIGELQQLKNLTVSSNRKITELPKEIGNLQQLKNLKVSFNEGITELPKEIGNLQHLETLDVSYTEITELPREIGNLQQLEALNLAGVDTITKLPREIGKLQRLETLDLSHTKVRKIPRQIGGLKKLKNLELENNDIIRTLPFEAGQLSRLEGLSRWSRRAWKNSDLVSSVAREILSFGKTNDSWGDDYGELIIGTKHMHMPRWIKEHFNNIGALDIRVCKLDEPDLKILREMPRLYCLTLRFEAVPRKPIAISGGGFAKLEILAVDSRVPRITFQQGAMTSLGSLVFELKYYGGPPNTDPMGIKHLVSLERVVFQCNDEWYRRDSPCISATIDVVIEEAREHLNKITFQMPGERKAEVSHEFHLY